VIEESGGDTPPTSPVEGAVYLTGAAPSGVWSGKPAMLAGFLNGGWDFIAPQDGWRIWDKSAAELKIWTGGGLTAANGATSTLGVNTGADATNRLSVSAPATLFSHEGAGHQVKINKSTAGDTASLLFQSAWSGYAEMGLAGSNAFSIKVSDTGATWTDALTFDGASGTATFAAALSLSPASEPSTPTAGTIYFDATTSKLRCYDGTLWNDLF